MFNYFEGNQINIFMDNILSYKVQTTQKICLSHKCALESIKMA